MTTGRMEAIILLFSVATSGAAASLGTQGMELGNPLGASEGHGSSTSGSPTDCTTTGDGSQAMTWFADVDGDGWGDWDVQVRTCAPGEASIPVTNRAGDCDDHDDRIGPHAAEIPGNGIDDDCDGRDAPRRRALRRGVR